MNIEEIRWDILEELQHLKEYAANMADNSALSQDLRQNLFGQSVAYANFYHYIKHYGEETYEEIL